VTNSISLESIALFAIIFLWTPAHFWALALFKSEDYGRAGVPMLPNVAGERTTKNQIVLYAVLTAVSGIVPTLMGFAGVVYGGHRRSAGRCLHLVFRPSLAYARWRQEDDPGQEALRLFAALSVRHLHLASG
jgi:heme O synthase-like polyprenyltransferase